MSDETVARLAEAKAAVLHGKVVPLRAKRTWQPPTLEDFADGHVLAFDQTFTNTGWCHLYLGQVNGERSLTIRAKGTLKEPPLPDLTGQEDTLQRSTWMAERISDTYQDACRDEPHLGPITVVHERPAVGGFRIESSLLGGLGVWMAMSPRRPVIVSNTHMRQVLTGEPKASSKALVTEAVNRYTDTKGWNADQRDSLALALTFLYDQKAAAA